LFKDAGSRRRPPVSGQRHRLVAQRAVRLADAAGERQGAEVDAVGRCLRPRRRGAAGHEGGAGGHGDGGDQLVDALGAGVAVDAAVLDQVARPASFRRGQHGLAADRVDALGQQLGGHRGALGERRLRQQQSGSQEAGIQQCFHEQ
jgi:hypothetical protein